MAVGETSYQVYAEQCLMCETSMYFLMYHILTSTVGIQTSLVYLWSLKLLLAYCHYDHNGDSFELSVEGCRLIKQVCCE
jgi:hypothetical protein